MGESSQRHLAGSKPRSNLQKNAKNQNLDKMCKKQSRARARLRRSLRREQEELGFINRHLVTLQCNSIFSFALRYSTLYYITCLTLHYITLHNITQHVTESELWIVFLKYRVEQGFAWAGWQQKTCLLYTSPSPRD